MVAAPTHGVRGAFGVVLRSGQLSLPAKGAALGAALLAGLAAPAGLSSWVLAAVFQPAGPAHRAEPGWLEHVVRFGPVASLATALACLSWALVRNHRGRADGELLVYATVGLLVAFVGCVVAGAVVPS